MKRAITLLLALLMLFSLVACGNQTNTKESRTTNEQTESTALDSEETGTAEDVTETEATTPSAEPETEPSTESAEETPAFDTSWASNEFESQIAEPEFENWNVSSYIEGLSWKIFVSEVHYDDVKAYAANLRSYGFADNESESDGYNGLAYIFEADNKNGFHAKLIFEAIEQNGYGNFSLEISKKCSKVPKPE